MTALAAVIVAHGSQTDLDRVLPVLGGQLADDDELVVVDSASPVPVRVPHGVRLLRSDVNVGFAGGAVLGADATRAPLLLFVNPDLVPRIGCVDALRAAADEHPDWGAWQAVVTLAGRTAVNTSGNVVHWTGIGWAGGYGRAAPVADGEVGFASGALLAVRREAWASAGAFDARYFMYGEDLDLGLRLRLAGWGSGVVAAALAEHDYDFAKGGYKWLHLERNRWWTVLSDYPTALLLAVLPALLALEVVLLAVALRGGWLGSKLRAQARVLRELPVILRRRRAVQATRSVPVARFADGFTSTLDSPFLGPVAEVGTVAAAQRLYWTGVRALLRCTSG